jgi:hypothetical protein
MKQRTQHLQTRYPPGTSRRSSVLAGTLPRLCTGLWAAGRCRDTVKYAPAVFGLIRSGLMSFLVSGIATLRAGGVQPGFLMSWINAWSWRGPRHPPWSCS